MRLVPRTARLSVVGLALLTVIGCTDSTTAPAHAQEATGSLDQELLLAILDRLEGMEERFEEESIAIHARLDSLAAAGLSPAVVARAPGGQQGPPDDVRRGGFTAQVEGLEARTDSIMSLVNFIARGTSSPWQGFTVCGGLSMKGKADLKSRTAARANGAGGVGVKPWDTGALADLAVGQSGLIEFGAGAEAQLAANGCFDLSKIGLEPPLARSGQLFPNPPEIAQLEATLTGLSDQLGFDLSRIEQAVSTGTDIFESGDLTTLGNLRTALPTPPSLGDPLALARSSLSTFDPVDLLCNGGNFGSRIGPRVSEACGLIMSDDLPELTTFLDLGSNFSSLDTRVDDLDTDLTSLDTHVGTVCSRLNDVIDRRLVIDNDGPLSVDQRLFPSRWSLTC